MVLLTVSKSIDVNLNSRRKNGGTRILVLRCVEDMMGNVDRGFGQSHELRWSYSRPDMAIGDVFLMRLGIMK